MPTGMATALAPNAVTQPQLALIKRTLASGATDDELALYLHDCARHGVHPLDKLLHFTKRAGKYTPITSIDFMRSRAHDTHECAGIGDPSFTGDPKQAGFAASVTVKRLVQGQVCDFTATARWEEYCPASGQDHMWRKMPHTMLGKCSEALALRKAFPQQLSGLYAREEMDQAGPEPTLTVKAPTVETVDAQTGEVTETPVERPTPPAGAVYIEHVTTQPTKNKNVTKYLIAFSDGVVASTIKPQLANLCEQLAQEALAVIRTTEATKWGENLTDVRRADAPDDDELTPPVDFDGEQAPF